MNENTGNSYELKESRFDMIIPGTSYNGKLPDLTDAESAAAERLRSAVVMLADTIGIRSTEVPEGLERAAGYIENQFLEFGYVVHRETYLADNIEVSNIIAEKKGTEKHDEIIVIGAHYDTVLSMTPGADDNASGIAGVIELARLFSKSNLKKTLRFVAFVNEEPPYFQTDLMGSRVYARGCRLREDNIVAMLCLECLGYYSDSPKSQVLPSPLDKSYPNIANYIAFCSNVGSYQLLRKCIKGFRKSTKFPSEGLIASERISVIGWSDHWSFWQEGYPAIMITDTALFRNSTYHLPTDTADTLDYEKMARVVCGIGRAVEGL